MAYISIALPAPAANGSGAAVDMSSFGAEKTITVTAGGNSVLRPSVVIEMSNQASPTKWAPVAFFTPGGETTVVVAARWMRATVQNFKGGNAPTIDVGGEDTGASFATLVAPAGVSGTGAGVDVSALPLFKTVHVAGPFQGALNIEISQDGGATYQQAFSFPSNTAGIQSKQIAADYMRVTRNGVPTLQPGTPIINIGATDLAGASGLVVQDEGVAVGTFPTLNFTGSGITATAAGSVVDVSVPNNQYGSLQYVWEDEWFLQAQLAVGNGWNGVPVGARPYSLVLIGANTALSQVTGSQRLGVVSLDSGTTNAGIAGLNTEATLAFDAGTFDEISFEFVGGIPTLDDGADSFNVQIGLIGNAPGYGVFFVYDPTNSSGFNAGLSANWLLVTEEAGVFTATDSGIALGAAVFPNTNMFRLKCQYQSAAYAGTATPIAKFLINGVQVGTSILTLPSHSLAGSFFITKSAGVNVRKLYVDYTALGCVLNTPRLP